MVVVGSGIAGLAFALNTARRTSVVLITKKAEADSNTNYAQGGIAAVLGPDDDPALHIEDTLEAGDGLCHPDVVARVVREGPDRIRDLVNWGVRFHRERESLHLGREGGHSRRRIVHAADRTGREIERALLAAVDEMGVTILEDHLAADLVTFEDPRTGRPRCGGIIALDHHLNRRVCFRAPVTMLASGGCGQVYRHTTNPPIATGDGVAMAYRAGARIGNMEFIQFHPTALFPTEDPAFLISEAVRGEGAILRTTVGTAFMDEYDSRGSLASRDIVARAVHAEMKKSGDDHVVLDISSIPRKKMEASFPGAVQGCLDREIDLFRDGIPVVPAAHYACGGVITDGEGRTSLEGLYAAGEVACTGMHGANRLASNSLLEAVVFSHRAADAVLKDLEGDVHRGNEAVAASERAPGAEVEDRASPADLNRVAKVRGRIRDLMWENVGIVRSDAELETAAGALDRLARTEEERWATGPWSVAGAELRNLALTARLIIESARMRKESRGLHFNVDHPRRDDEEYGEDTVLQSSRIPRSTGAAAPGPDA